MTDIEDCIAPNKRTVLGASIPFHSNPHNANDANQTTTPILVARVPNVPNQYVLHFQNQFHLLGNVVEKELLLMKEQGTIFAAYQTPTNLETRTLLRMTLRSGTNVYQHMRLCLARLRAKFAAMRASYEKQELGHAEVTDTKVAKIHAD